MSRTQNTSREHDRGTEPSDADPTAALRGATGFIAPGHLTPETLQGLGEWLHATPSRPFVLRDFVEPGQAAAMGAAMRALPVWTRCVTAFRNESETEDIPARDWAEHPRRAAHHNVARDLRSALEEGAMSAEHQIALRRFLSRAALGDVLRNWITAGTGIRLTSKEASLELASYDAGDQIRPHQDLVPRRVFAVNFYLDEEYRPGTGGRLVYRNEEDDEFAVEPLFNTFSVIQIRPDAWHHVEAYEGTGTGRFTVSVGLHGSE
ncbi:2OG-Fe(II) oxygenase [Streptomyces sp. NBC_01278]|uniref:2OG-Fe(II) oxygenase n=1 Tax=Streptomyces sp. NBC_01278 TaxID=2903809 RepID=UPI002E35981C|nr:2OG-Fe(II) oxygenase [Streptomyces sp. NBC_01278]